ncbi:uncharacterized protein I206_101653 [Kwoniella pini CBS 10737]|uniref:DUF1996 domain-containing protein n=1 Tax=Kwoniella pini CBS 10737 TaxID=1296096 RepID=A0A1B9HW28_9TREE|nr:uncharacterized protein I206_06377 [Kwoniella pini CBS 10737]OCF47476.1 hypothetical protein I206_06377 [Kwoniella pini CBS 10737]
MFSRSLFNTLLYTLIIIPGIKGQAANYDSLLFTEDFFPLINSRIDPIISPGKVSGHVHHIVGGSSFSVSQDYSSSRNAKCTSSNLICDHSNYWTPHLYYKWRNGSYTAVTGDGATNYWKYPLTNVNEGDQPFAAIPDDFRMLAGNISRNDYDENKAVSFLCIDAQSSYDYTDYIPTNRECLTLRPQLHFPECWNGVDSYKEDNSHVAYPIDHNPEGGICPEGFQKIPHLFMESTYHIKTENIGEGYEWYPGCFVLANGDNHGFTLHADWLNGFPSNFLTEAFKQCYDKSSELFIKDCQFIQQYRGDTGRDCITEGDVINELVGQHYSIPSLPGDNLEFNSSKYSSNYPKPSNQAYIEKSSMVKVSKQNGGYCIQGECTDYKGSHIILPQNNQIDGTDNQLTATSVTTYTGQAGTGVSASSLSSHTLSQGTTSASQATNQTTAASSPDGALLKRRHDKLARKAGKGRF